MKTLNVFLIVVLAVTVFYSAAQADVIQCGFTEPFVSTTYSMAQQTLTYKNDVEKNQKVIKNVSFQIKDAGTFELVSKNGDVLQTIKLTNNGSDGMSDTLYPYEVKDSGLVKFANGGIGGCSSNYLKTKQREE
jgi:uncharacterized membrane protein